MNRTQVERTRRLREANKARGLKPVTVTVPAERVEELKDMARQWREAIK